MRPIFSTYDSFDSIRACLMSKRTFVVRGAVDPVAVAALGARAEKAYASWDTEGRFDPLFKQGHIPAADIGAEALERVANDGYLKALKETVFRWDDRLECPRDFLLRRILPPTIRHEHIAPSIPFHQDEYFGIASDPNCASPQLCFTMWLPLVDCGADAPGLSVVVGSDRPIVMGDPREGWQRYIRTNYGWFSTWSPKLKAGDLLVFTSRVIHGSYVTQKMKRPRYSVEIRGGIN